MHNILCLFKNTFLKTSHHSCTVRKSESKVREKEEASDRSSQLTDCRPSEIRGKSTGGRKVNAFALFKHILINFAIWC